MQETVVIFILRKSESTFIPPTLRPTGTSPNNYNPDTTQHNFNTTQRNDSLHHYHHYCNSSETTSTPPFPWLPSPPTYLSYLTNRPPCHGDSSHHMLFLTHAQGTDAIYLMFFLSAVCQCLFT